MPHLNPSPFRHAAFQGRIGVARSDITPPIGIYARNWGAGSQSVARSIHRSLTLTALTLTPATGGCPLILLDADLGSWKSLQTCRDFLSRLQEELAADPANLIFSLSHTHSAPVLMDAEDSLPGSDLHRKWMAALFDTAIDTARQALREQFEGTLDWHTGRCSLATDRNLPDPDLTRQRFICGYNPQGDPDDTVLVGRVTDETGSIRATLVNYACHPTTLAWENEAISPDYVGATRATIEQATSAPALFLQGNSGELAPRYQYVGDHEVADRHGRELGFAALAALNAMEPSGAQLSYAGVVESGAPLAIWKHEIRQPSRELRALIAKVELKLKEWPSAEEVERQSRECLDGAFEERLRRKHSIRLSIGDDANFTLPIHIWRVGDALLIGTCCEANSVLQRTLRERFSETTIVCMNLINGSIGYAPPAELYDADTYTVWQTPFERGSYERLLEAATRTIRDALNDGGSAPRHRASATAPHNLGPRLDSVSFS